MERVARVGEKRNAYGVLVARPERKRQLGRHRCGWEYNINSDLKYGGRAWTAVICFVI